jgi:hypothetical protein
MFRAAQIMQGTITPQKLKLHGLEIHVRPRVKNFAVLDFFRANQVWRAAEGCKGELYIKLMLGERMRALGNA